MALPVCAGVSLKVETSFKLVILAVVLPSPVMVPEKISGCSPEASGELNCQP